MGGRRGKEVMKWKEKGRIVEERKRGGGNGRGGKEEEESERVKDVLKIWRGLWLRHLWLNAPSLLPPPPPPPFPAQGNTRGITCQASKAAALTAHTRPNPQPFSWLFGLSNPSRRRTRERTSHCLIFRFLRPSLCFVCLRLYLSSFLYNKFIVLQLRSNYVTLE